MAYSFEHLLHLSDDIGIFEHAEYESPRLEHGYCVDDVARALIVIAREPNPDPQLSQSGAVYLRFLVDAMSFSGRFHNRRNHAGEWTDDPGLEDHWGRALWALGTAGARLGSRSALALFNLGARQRSPWLHAMCFAALGAAEVLATDPRNPEARALLRAAAERLHVPKPLHDWPWPESRLRYANAAIPQVLLHAGALLDEPAWTRAGVQLLEWLVDVETNDGHISVTPVGGWTLGEPRPGFDQQPIEVAALADACVVAYEVTGDARWQLVVQRCAQWFDGDNDAHVPVADPERGIGFDGLHADAHNANAGAESTLALLSTMQAHDRMLVTM